MAAPRKDPDELRERAIRMALDQVEEGNGRAVFRRVGEQLGINPETLRGRVRQRQIDLGDRPVTSTDESQRVMELEKEVRELRRANAILRSASAFFAAELDRPTTK